MAEYRFFGTETVIAGTAISRYGQVVELDPVVAESLIAGSPPALLLPADLWDEIGFTDEELAQYPSAKMHGAAPEEFRAKSKSVRAKAFEFRERLHRGENTEQKRQG